MNKNTHAWSLWRPLSHEPYKQLKLTIYTHCGASTWSMVLKDVDPSRIIKQLSMKLVFYNEFI